MPVSQKFCNILVIVAFVKFVKMMKDTGLWDVELAWYSPSATHWIFFYGLEHSLEI